MVKTSHNRRPAGKRVLRVAIITLGSLLVAVVALLIFLTNGDLGRFKGPLLGYASEALGRELRIDGDLSIRFGRDLNIRATEVYLADAEWSEDEHMLTAGEIAVSLVTSSILTGPLQIHSLELHDASILVTSNDAGDSNWQLFPEAPPDEVEADSDGVPLLVDEANASNIHIRLSGPALQGASEIHIESYIHGVNGDRIADTLSGTINGFALSFNSDFGPRQNIWRSEPVDIQLTGALGEVTLTASALVDDLLDPARPSASVQLYGPDASYLLNILELPPIANGPLTLSSKISLGDDRVNVETRVEVGEFVFDADGWLSEVDAEADFDFSFNTSGKALNELGRLFAVERIPGGPFNASGNLGRDAGSISFSDVRLDIGSTSLVLNGTLDQFAPPSGRALRLAVRGDDIAELRELLQVPGVLSGPFNVEISLPDASEAALGFVATGTIGEIYESITVVPSDAPDFVGTTIEFEIRGPDSTAITDALEITGITAQPFQTNGTVEYRGKGLQFSPTRLTLGRSNLDIAGYVAMADGGAGSELQIGFDTPSLDETLRTFGIEDAPPGAAKLQTLLTIGTELIKATSIDASINGIGIQGSISTSTEHPGATASFDVSVETDNLSKSWPPGGEYAPPASAASVRALGRLTDALVELDDLSIRIGDARFKLDGVIDRPPKFDATSFSLSADIPSLAALGSTGQNAFPDLPVTLSGQFKGTHDSVMGQDVSAKIGDGQIETDFSYQHADIPIIGIRLTSPSLDLRPFLPEEEDKPEAAAAAKKTGRRIPDAEIPVDRLRVANVNADIRLAELILPGHHLTDVDFRATIVDGGITVEKLSLRGLKGQLSASLSYLPTNGSYQLATSVDGSNLILRTPHESRDQMLAKPTFDLKTTLTARGTGVHALLATLDGNVVINSGPGTIPNANGRLGALFLGDFLVQVMHTINPFAKSSNEMNLDCAVLLLDIDDGVISGAPAMVTQLAAVTASASGSLNLKNEALDFDMTTKQRRGIGISISDLVNPYFRIAGTLSAPKMVLDQKGALIEGGAAIATGGLTVLAKGMRDRFLSDGDPCGTALKDYREAH